MAFGFGVLRHSSQQFWGMTPRELKAAMDGMPGARPTSLTRTNLETLMALFPDLTCKDIPS